MKSSQIPKTIKVECEWCNATGVRVGIDTRVPKGDGRACHRCNGRGWKSVSYTPFFERKKRDDVVLVHGIDATGEKGGAMNYRQWFKYTSE